MKRHQPSDIGASVKARLLNLAKARGEDFNLTLINFAAERFLYRLSCSGRRNQFVLKGAMLFAVRIGEAYRPTRDRDLLGRGDTSEEAIAAAIRDIVGTAIDNDGIEFDGSSLQVQPIREDDRYGGLRVLIQARLTEARIRVQIDVGFGDAVTPEPLDLNFPTLLPDLPPPNILAYPTETIISEKTQAMVELGIANSRMKDFADIAMAARRLAFEGETLVAALRATFHRRETPLPELEVLALSELFLENVSAQANWKAFTNRNRAQELGSLAQVVAELRLFLLVPLENARTGKPFRAVWSPGGPWESLH